MKIRKFLSAFTLIELLVVISIIAILAGIALPVFSQVQIKGAQTKALSNSKQIGLALKVYATDNSGVFPSYTMSGSPLAPTTTQVGFSNLAFCQLFPQYLTTETIFWLAMSPECSSSPPNNIIDNPFVYPPTNTLKAGAGENHWAYVLGLFDTSTSSFPLIADAFTDPVAHTYSSTVGQPGSVWSGTRAVVIRVDCSGALEKVDATSLEVLQGPGSSDLFSNTSTTWLGASNSVVNPD